LTIKSAVITIIYRRMQNAFTGENTPPYEHTDGKRWDYSPTNQLIANFKKSPDRRHLPEWRHKEAAIKRLATAFSKLINWEKLTNNASIAIIPIPPSKSKNDPLHDDRMMQMLTQMMQLTTLALDIRDCLAFTGHHAASHQDANRPTPEALYNDLQLDQRAGKLTQQPDRVFVFDDVLTTAAHFVAVKRKLNKAFPDSEVIGFFIARRVLPNPFDDFEAL
jgi:predicted amidophosphoribosyltransferase